MTIRQYVVLQLYLQDIVALSTSPHWYWEHQTLVTNIFYSGLTGRVRASISIRATMDESGSLFPCFDQIVIRPKCDVNA